MLARDNFRPVEDDTGLCHLRRETDVHEVGVHANPETRPIAFPADGYRAHFVGEILQRFDRLVHVREGIEFREVELAQVGVLPFLERLIRPGQGIEALEGRISSLGQPIRFTGAM